MTASDKPPPAHPAPWSYITGHWGRERLRDANGATVLRANGNTYTFDVVDEVTAELIRSAPEMETFLRAIETNFTNICPACDRTRGGGHEPGCAFEALIARLDAARKAGG